MTEIISDMLANPKIDTAAIDAERSTIIREAEEIAKDKTEAIFDHLHAIAFQGECWRWRLRWKGGGWRESEGRREGEI